MNAVEQGSVGTRWTMDQQEHRIMFDESTRHQESVGEILKEVADD